MDTLNSYFVGSVSNGLLLGSISESARLTGKKRNILVPITTSIAEIAIPPIPSPSSGKLGT